MQDANANRLSNTDVLPEVSTHTLDGGEELPLFIEPVSRKLASSLDDAAAWLSDNKIALDGLLRQFGALVFRGFPVVDAGAFERIVACYPGFGSGYIGGTSPRAVVTGRVMEATQAPASRRIPLHQEMCYSPVFPLKLAFYCEHASATGGETIVGDMRRFTRDVSKEFYKRIRERGICYTRFFRDDEWLPGHPELDVVHRSWQQAFCTQDKAEAEAACITTGSGFEWVDGGMLATFRSPGVIRHPDTNEELWFNSISGMALNRFDLGERLFDLYEEYYGDRHRRPFSLSYGDGSKIADEDMFGLYPLSDKITVSSPWQNGDIMLVDNIYSAHGRNPFTGERKVRVVLLD